MTLPADIASCPGVGFVDPDVPGGIDWREGCEDCLRRTSPTHDQERALQMTPPPIIAFWCEYHIPTGSPVRADTTTTPTTPDITSSLRAMRAAARPCGTSEDGRTVLAIHLDERRADDLLAAADEIDRITEAGRAHIRRAAQFEDERDALRAELARWNAELSAVMPADFKDLASSPERPQLAAWVIRNLRERLAETDGIAVATGAAALRADLAALQEKYEAALAESSRLMDKVLGMHASCKAHKDRARAAEAERDALQAELAALQAQEPVAWLYTSYAGEMRAHILGRHNPYALAYDLAAAHEQPDKHSCVQLYAAPVAQGPAYYVTVTGRLHETEPTALAFNLPDGRHPLYTTSVATREPSDEQIREALLACGYTIKPGRDDLLPYVYEGARAVLALQRALSATQPPGEGR